MKVNNRNKNNQQVVVCKFQMSIYLLKNGGQKVTGQFNVLLAIAIDSSDNVYVADTDNHRIQKFDSNGNFITKWGDSGRFDTIIDISLDSLNNIYVADSGNDNVQKFDSNGNFITQWTSEDFLKQWSSEGNDTAQYFRAFDLAIDSEDNLYGADLANHRIQKFDSNGKYIIKWGSEGNGTGQFKAARSIAVDSADNIYVTDDFNNRIQKFDSNGNFITKWEIPGKYNIVYGIAVDPNTNNVYVADSDNARIQVFAPSS
jgi:DNA-binding beta-propeller fold protein YncE